MSRVVYDRGDRLRLSPVTVTAELFLLQNSRILRRNMVLLSSKPSYTPLVIICSYIGAFINRALETSLLNHRKSFVIQEACMYKVLCMYVCMYVCMYTVYVCIKYMYICIKYMYVCIKCMYVCIKYMYV
jgi:hypothetical protein